MEILILLVFFLVFIYFVVQLAAPLAIQQAVEHFPVPFISLKFHSVDLLGFKDYGLDVAFSTTVKYTKIPLPFARASATIPQIECFDMETGYRLASMFLSSPMQFSHHSDAKITQSVKIMLEEDIDALRKLVTVLSVGGVKEMKRLKLRIRFTMSLNIMGIFNFERIQCGKTLNWESFREQSPLLTLLNRLNSLKDLWEDEPDYTLLFNALAVDDFQKSDGKDEPIVQLSPLPLSFETIPEMPVVIVKSPDVWADLFPGLVITPTITPNGRTVDAGLDIEFNASPAVNFSMGQVSFVSLLNGAVLAKTTADPFTISPDSKSTKMKFHIEPYALKDAKGTLSTARGFVSGVSRAVFNGVIYGEWGKNSSEIGIQEISILAPNGEDIPWLSKLLHGRILEYDISEELANGGSIALEKTEELSNALRQITAGVLKHYGWIASENE